MAIGINPFSRNICSSSLYHFSQQKTVTQRIILTFGVSTAQKAAEQREGTVPGAATWISSLAEGQMCPPCSGAGGSGSEPAGCASSNTDFRDTEMV